MVLLFSGHCQGCRGHVQAKELGVLFEELVNLMQ